jgi:Sulfotransferase domain
MSDAADRGDTTPAKLPHFLIIGAPKAGTTWLVRCLRRHPQLFVPQQELHYWTNSALVEDRHAWYLQHFAKATAGQIRGDRSNSYLTQSEVAPLIAKSMPGVKLVAIFREPVDRAYSGYCMRLRFGDVGRDIERYLDPESSLCPDILHNSLYHERLKPYLACFPSSRMHFMLFDDIQQRPQDALNELCQFLGVEPLAAQMLIAAKVNPKEKSWLPTWLLRLARNSPALRALSHAFQKTSLGKLVRSRLERRIVYPALPPPLRRRMAAYFRADVDSLSGVVQRDLSAWFAED